MLNWMRILFISLACLLVVGACARRQRPTPTPGPTPTAIVYPATWTPDHLPGTMVAPTQTPAPPTRVPDATTLEVLKAIKRTNGLNVYSAHIEMIASSPTVSLLGETPGTPIRVLTMEGNVDRNNSRWAMSGALIGYLTGDASSPLEVRTLDNRAYLLGPLPYLGASEKRWYATPVQVNDQLYGTVGTRSTLGLFADANVSFPTFRTDGAQVLDQRPCTLYRADKAEAGKYYADLDAQTKVFNGSIRRFKDQPTTAELNVWVCDDGYIHKLEMRFEIKCGCTRQDRANFAVDLRLWDMNIIIPVQAPDGAVPLPSPFMFPTRGPDVETS
ncbi:MAG: hypothetical protein HY741_16755 [Chloroflexi bacterium]|nr:hypothetical protein [Chloroflexota bacterium]